MLEGSSTSHPTKYHLNKSQYTGIIIIIILINYSHGFYPQCISDPPNFETPLNQNQVDTQC